MALALDAFIGLDVVSCCLTLVIAGFFAFLARRTHDWFFLLFSMGFLVLGLSFLTVAPSQFQVGESPGTWDGLRIALLIGGSFVLMFAYVSLRVLGSARPWLVLGWTVAAASLVLAGIFLAVPRFQFLPPPERVFPVAHAAAGLAMAACSFMATAGLVKRASLDRALVPVAFLALALGQYTWLLIDLTQANALVPFVYAWRFLALGLFLTALRVPVLQREADAVAPA